MSNLAFLFFRDATLPAGACSTELNTVQTVRWMNRHTAACGLSALLLGLAACAHQMAFRWINLTDANFAGLDGRIVRRILIVEFIDAHLWIILPYVALCLVSQLRLEWRDAPRWAVWLTFGFLAMPCLLYVWGCLRLITSSI